MMLVSEPNIHASLVCCFSGYCTQDGNTALHWATKKGHKDCVLHLLEAGASITIEDKVSSFVSGIRQPCNLSKAPVCKCRRALISTVSLPLSESEYDNDL